MGSMGPMGPMGGGRILDGLWEKAGQTEGQSSRPERPKARVLIPVPVLQTPQLNKTLDLTALQVPALL